MALNCKVSPAFKAAGADGEIAIAERVVAEDITVKLMMSLVYADRDAVMSVEPSATPVARPFGEMIATPVSELFHVTALVMSSVDPSEYVPVAVNCCVEPTLKL